MYKVLTLKATMVVFSIFGGHFHFNVIIVLWTCGTHFLTFIIRYISECKKKKIEMINTSKGLFFTYPF